MKLKKLSKFFGKFAAFSLSLITVLGLAPNAFSWGTPSHRAVARAAISSTGLKKFGILNQEEILNISRDAVINPDKKETEDPNLFLNPSKGHFYDPHRGFGKQDQDNAATRLKLHFNLAVLNFQRGDYEIALEELFNGMHYIQDMCCPVHLWGYDYNIIPANLATHVAYEQEVDKYCDECANQFVEKFENSNTSAKSKKVRKVEEMAILYAKKVYSETYKKFISISSSSVADSLLINNPVALVVKPLTIAKRVKKLKKEAVNKRENWDWEFDRACEASCELIYIFCRKVGINLESKPDKTQNIIDKSRQMPN